MGFLNPCRPCIHYREDRCAAGVVEWFGMLCAGYHPNVEQRRSSVEPVDLLPSWNLPLNLLNDCPGPDFSTQSDDPLPNHSLGP